MGGPGPEEPGRREAEVEERLREILGEELEGRLEEEIARFGGLIDRRTAVLLLGRRLGVVQPRITPMAEAEGGPITVEGEVIETWEKNGKLFARLRDPSGEGILVLEGSDRLAATVSGLSPGRRVRLIGVEASPGRGTRWIRLGKWGMMRFMD